MELAELALGEPIAERDIAVDEAEAAIVRTIFARFLALGSLPALQRELRAKGIVTRQRAMSSGTIRGGVPLTNGPLQHMLRNRVYRGELNHRGQSYPAEHAAIVDAALFDAVQARLDANRRAHGQKRQHAEALLTGLLYDDRGNRMGPSYAVKNGMRYRYYVSAAATQGRKADAGSVARVPARDIETAVRDALAAAGHGGPSPVDREGLVAVVERITVRSGHIEIRLTDPDARPAPITVTWARPSQHRRRDIVKAAEDQSAGRPIRAEARSRLLHGIARGRAWLDAIMSGAVPDIDAIAEREAISIRAARMTLSLAFLAPDIVEAAADGSLPRGFGLSRLTDLPPRWDEQRRVLGIRP